MVDAIQNGDGRRMEAEAEAEEQERRRKQRQQQAIFFLVASIVCDFTGLFIAGFFLGAIGAFLGYYAVKEGSRLGYVGLVFGVTTFLLTASSYFIAPARLLDIILDIINVGLFASALRLATPLVYASLGGVFSERAGIVNVGLEGMMLMGAFSGVVTSFFTRNAWLGVLSAVFTGGLFGLLHGVLTVKFAGNQIVSGTGINLFALGFTAYMSQAIGGSRGGFPSRPLETVPGIPVISLQFLKGSIPLVGDIIAKLFSQSPLVYMMFVVVVLSYIVLFKTPLGLRIRAVGEHPAAADTAGVNVYRTKYLCLFASGMLAGLGGVFLSLGTLSMFVLGMTGGRGFIALAAMILGRWKPFGALAASFMFGILYALQMGLQSTGWLPPQIIQATPYVLTVIVLAGFVRKAKAPSDYKPYEKE